MSFDQGQFNFDANGSDTGYRKWREELDAARLAFERRWGVILSRRVEVVLEDNPRRDSTIFTIQLWNPVGPEPESLWAISERQKDIQFASRDNSHIAKQQQIHNLRHIIRELAMHVPEKMRGSKEVKALTAWGCGTTMHVVHMLAPRLAGEDSSKDIDFSGHGISGRWQAGLNDARRTLAVAPWRQQVDSKGGVVIHNFEHGHA